MSYLHTLMGGIRGLMPKNGEFLTQIRVGGEFLTQVPIAAAHACSSCLQQIVRLQEIVLRSTGTTLQLMEYLPFAMSCSTTGKEWYMYPGTTVLQPCMLEQNRE